MNINGFISLYHIFALCTLSFQGLFFFCQLLVFFHIKTSENIHNKKTVVDYSDTAMYNFNIL